MARRLTVGSQWERVVRRILGTAAGVGLTVGLILSTDLIPPTTRMRLTALLTSLMAALLVVAFSLWRRLSAAERRLRMIGSILRSLTRHKPDSES
jgi:hypothetical protein